MKHYAQFDADGLPAALFNEDAYPPGEDGSVNPGIPADAVELSADQWTEIIHNQGHRRWDGSELHPYTPPPPLPPVAYMTGKDVIDGMSRVQANDPAVDQRDVVRIATAPRASEVKGCIRRVEHDLKLPAGALLAQATATGGL